MATAASRGTISRLWLGVWILLGLSAAWFIYDSINYVASRDPQPVSLLSW